MNRMHLNKNIKIAMLKFILIINTLFFSTGAHGYVKMKIALIPDQGMIITKQIQKAIDACAVKGGGIVYFPKGTYLTGTIELKSKVTLQTENGTIIKGSSNYADYINDAFIFGKDVTDISILGAGIIDGVDCKNPNGEEGFRGPHCIKLINCKNISLEGITIKNSANWAINCRYCTNATLKNVLIRGGHDGLHTRFCSKFTVKNCDFRTGDDTFAGNDNKDFLVTDCKINTSCNGFRMGCYNFTVKRCRLWGPGESIHKSSNRNNMLTAFVHFSPKDENPQLISGNWLIEDLTVENVDHFYMYNYIDGLWQTGKPVENLRFKRIKATGLLSAFNIIGDTALNCNLKVQNSSFSFRKNASYDAGFFEGVKIASHIFFDVKNFNTMKLQNVALEKAEATTIFNCKTGNNLRLNQVKFINFTHTMPYSIKDVKVIAIDGFTSAAAKEKLK